MKLRGYWVQLFPKCKLMQFRLHHKDKSLMKLHVINRKSIFGLSLIIVMLLTYVIADFIVKSDEAVWIFLLFWGVICLPVTVVYPLISKFFVSLEGEIDIVILFSIYLFFLPRFISLVINYLRKP